MSAPGVTSVCTWAPWIDTPVCSPPFGKDTHSVHFGRRQACWADTVAAAVKAARTIAAGTITTRMLGFSLGICVIWADIGRLDTAVTACARRRRDAPAPRADCHRQSRRALRRRVPPPHDRGPGACAVRVGRAAPA